MYMCQYVCLFILLPMNTTSLFEPCSVFCLDKRALVWAQARTFSGWSAENLRGPLWPLAHQPRTVIDWVRSFLIIMKDSRMLITAAQIYSSNCISLGFHGLGKELELYLEVSSKQCLISSGGDGRTWWKPELTEKQ